MFPMLKRYYQMHNMDITMITKQAFLWNSPAREAGEVEHGCGGRHTRTAWWFPSCYTRPLMLYCRSLAGGRERRDCGVLLDAWVPLVLCTAVGYSLFHTTTQSSGHTVTVSSLPVFVFLCQIFAHSSFQQVCHLQTSFPYSCNASQTDWIFRHRECVSKLPQVHWLWPSNEMAVLAPMPSWCSQRWCK